MVLHCYCTILQCVFPSRDVPGSCPRPVGQPGRLLHLPSWVSRTRHLGPQVKQGPDSSGLPGLRETEGPGYHHLSTRKRYPLRLASLDRTALNQSYLMTLGSKSFLSLAIFSFCSALGLPNFPSSIWNRSFQADCSATPTS